MIKETAMKLALEALEWMVANDDTNEGDEPIDRLGGQSWNEYNAYWLDGLKNARASITALREALAEQPAQQEPVAIVDGDDHGYFAEILPDRSVKVGQLLYSSPSAQRTWVGLSPADRGKCLSAGDAHGWIGVMEATEARLKELNT